MRIFRAASLRAGAAVDTAGAVAMLCVLGAALMAAPHAAARGLPGPEAVAQSLGAPSQIKVFEPHLASADGQVEITYLGFPAVSVMDLVLGDGWRSAGEAVEFRALDGYVSRVMPGRFDQYSAWLVYARADGAPFTVDNPAQNETGVPLGPWYLAWDNIDDPDLIAEGARYWPYQVAEISTFEGYGDLLEPPGLDPRALKGGQLAREACIRCHRINGAGGDKFPVDLLDIVSAYDEQRWVRWLLEPSAVRPGTPMPPMMPRLEERERRQSASEIFTYLNAMRALR